MKKRALTLLILICLCLTACSPGSGVLSPAEDKTFEVVATFYPLYIAALNIIGEAPSVTLTMLAPPDAGCLHDYQLRPQDMAALARCDLLLTNGAGLELFLETALSKVAHLPIVTATDGLALLPQDVEATPDAHADADEHDHGDSNPHAWVSVSLYMRYVENIRDGLMANDPAHADNYQANAQAYIATLTALQDDMRATLKDLPHRDIVTFHEAFAYFAQEFDLRVAAVIQQEPGQNPSPKALSNTIALMESLHITSLFTEPQYTPTAAETIARETGAQLFTLDPVVTGEFRADAYESAMRMNADTLRRALS